MSGVLEKLDKLAADEDEDVMRIFNEWYGPLLYLSILFPSWKRENIKRTIISFGAYSFALGAHGVILSVSVLLQLDNFELASLTFHFWLIFMFVIVSIPLLHKDRQLLAATHRMFANTVGDYRPNNIYGEEKLQNLKKEQKKKLIKFLVLPGSVVLMAGGATLVPYMKKISEEEPGKTAFYTDQNVNLHLPVAAYYPFPTHEGLAHVAVVLGQLMAAAAVAIVLGTLELMSYRVSQAIIYEYQVLQHGVETIFSRAKKLHRLNDPDDKGPTNKHNHRYQHCVGLCFKDAIIHHHKIAVLSAGYEQLIKWPGALAYTFGTGVIALSLINIRMSIQTGNIEYIILFTMMSIIEVVNMYMISMFGEDITTESQVLRDTLYAIDWHKLNVQNRKIMLNFQTGITNPVIIKAGGLVAMCMDTFSSIMNSAYSFFNLMNVNYK